MEPLKTVRVAKILETTIWIESGFAGDRYVVVQHEGMEPFTYATFHYRYGYTDNAGTLHEATRLALQLGATEPVQIRQRDMPKMPDADEIRARIEALQALLTRTRQ